MADGPERRFPTASDDLALVQRVRRGDAAALPLLADRLRCVSRALQLLDRRNGSVLGPEELADLAQDVLVVVWRKLAEFEGRCPLEGWVYGMCALEYQNALRRQLRLRREAHAIVLQSGAPEHAALDPDPWAFEEVYDGLERIGREEAQVIRLKHFAGRTFDEIGRELRLSPNTIKTRYYRGLLELRERLEALDRERLDREGKGRA
jgi:RNA polymerase sigma-70 factor (ECF subfamily)